MSRRLAYGLYAAMAVSVSVHFFAERTGNPIPWVHAYLDDLFCMPLILFPVLLLFRRWAGPLYRFPVSYAVLTWVALCVVFELVLPLRDPRFTADGWDMVAYGLGGVLFGYMQRPFPQPAELGKV